MSIAGKIAVALGPGSAVEIRSTRPLQLTQTLQGLSAEAVVKRVPTLYALCGKAQGRAALLALRSAGLLPAYFAAQTDQECRVEAALEYLWRFAIDLPQWAGRPPALTAFAAIRRQLPQAERGEAGELLSRYLSDELLGVEPSEWSQLSANALMQWLEGSGSPAAALLREAASFPPVPSVPQPALLGDLDEEALRELAEAMQQPEFLAAPSWRARCAETGPLVYQAHGWFSALVLDTLSIAVRRLLARLLELVALSEQLLTDEDKTPVSGALALDEGVGLGWVRTARGLLVHRAQAAGSMVGDYRILAPTEWNFHPHGVLAEQLAHWQHVDAARRERWLALQVMSLDPCVAYELEVYDA